MTDQVLLATIAKLKLSITLKIMQKMVGANF